MSNAGRKNEDVVTKEEEKGAKRVPNAERKKVGVVTKEGE